MNRLFVILTIPALLFFSGCREMDLALTPTLATIGHTTALYDELVSLPEPEQKVVIAVYKFRDQTGQYKTSASATTFSTAVTQGATSVLTKTLDDSGWFIPIEREGLANLLNERKIITSTRIQAQASGGQKMPGLPPLLYAGVLVEGGIIGYDTNYVTGGFGARYFGVGGFGEMRKDRVTIYLRVISTQNGQVLKSVSTTKSVLSKEVDFGVYRYVSVKRLLEVETGLSTNEPVTMCVLEAIEKAVHDLVIEGIQDGLWNLKNKQDINSPVIQSYLEEKRQLGTLAALDKKDHPQKTADVDKKKPAVSQHLKRIEDVEAADTEQTNHQLVSATGFQVSKEAVIRVIPRAEWDENAGHDASIGGQGKSTSAITFLQKAIGKSSSESLEGDRTAIPKSEYSQNEKGK